MVPLITGVAAYIVAGILSLTYSRWRFWFGVFGWAGGLTGLATGIILYLRNGSLVGNLGRWGVLGVEIKLDETTLLFVALIVVLNVFTLAYLRTEKGGRFYCLYNFLLAASYSVAFSNDLFNLYVTIELMSLISILLIGSERKQYQIYAGIKYLLISSLAMSIYFIGLGFVYRAGGYLGIQELAGVIEGTTSLDLSLGFALMLTGLSAKGGVFLFSMWLPDAYTYSGTVVSVLLAGIGTKAGLLGIIRIAGIAGWNDLLLGLGAMTGIIGAGFAVISRSPKRVLSFSSISQTGYILLGIGMGTPAGFLVASLHVFFHGLFKGLLFISFGHAEIGNNYTYGDAIKSVPFSSKIGIAVGALSLMAIPPFSGYFSKTLLLEVAGHGWLRWVILVIGLGTVVYSLDLVRLFIVNTPTSEARKRDLPLLSLAGIVAISAVGVWFIEGTKAIFNLLSSSHISIAFALIIVGIIFYLGLRDRLKRYDPQDFPFNLDNSLVSFFTGFIFVAFLLCFA